MDELSLTDDRKAIEKRDYNTIKTMVEQILGAKKLDVAKIILEELFSKQQPTTWQE